LLPFTDSTYFAPHVHAQPTTNPSRISCTQLSDNVKNRLATFVGAPLCDSTAIGLLSKVKHLMIWHPLAPAPSRFEPVSADGNSLLDTANSGRAFGASLHWLHLLWLRSPKLLKYLMPSGRPPLYYLNLAITFWPSFLTHSRSSKLQ